ncbi:hypothetical protein AB0D30_14115 [Streptomyces sp. NPDC048409]|uniref:hypothetical protein n=1 Tax=Streptomyces sp. NPDC048409 TaxID=3154723 RepID=UPI003425E7A7
MADPSAPSHDFDLAYAEEDMGQVPGLFGRAPSSDGHGIVVTGECPRCHGRTATEYRHGAPGMGTKGLRSWLAGRQPAPDLARDGELLARETQFCECGHPHANLPQDAPFTGCGASWLIGEPAQGGAA